MVMKRCLMRVAFAYGVFATAIDVRRHFSIASHWALQYLAVVVLHEQTGCAHLLVFAVSIRFLPYCDRERVLVNVLVAGKTFFCTERHTRHRRKQLH
jgi:hypothetical protein